MLPDTVWPLRATGLARLAVVLSCRALVEDPLEGGGVEAGKARSAKTAPVAGGGVKAPPRVARSVKTAIWLRVRVSDGQKRRVVAEVLATQPVAMPSAN